METFGDRIKELRIYNNLSQTELAKKIGLSQNTISQYENNLRQPNLEDLKKLCLVLNVSADYILGITDIF